MPIEITPLDYSHFDGGLVRMLDRFKEQGTLTGDVEADDYLRRDANAALLGLLYDQRVRAEYAFTGPHRLRDRLGHLDMNKLAAMDLEALRQRFAEKPAVHRFTNTMADYTHAIARILTTNTTAMPPTCGTTTPTSPPSSNVLSGCPASARKSRPR